MDVINSKDDDKVAEMLLREKIRAELTAEIGAQAQAFVAEQIRIAHGQMHEEIERRLASKTVTDGQDPPLSQNRNPDYNPLSEPMELS